MATFDAGMGDWRLAKVARVAGDQVLPGGIPVKDGTVFWQTTITEDPQFGTVGFPTPSPVALALGLAIGAAGGASTARKLITYPTQMVDGSRNAEASDVPALYAYFEQCMLAVTFSFQSLEAYSNEVISRHDKRVTITRKKGPVTLTPDKLERDVSTEEKLASVLPVLTGIVSPKGTRIWQRFTVLKDVRDSTIHLKSADHYVRGKLDRESLYYRFLNSDPAEFPGTAIAMMRHFMGQSVERWLLWADGLLTGKSPP